MMVWLWTCLVNGCEVSELPGFEAKFCLARFLKNLAGFQPTRLLSVIL